MQHQDLKFAWANLLVILAPRWGRGEGRLHPKNAWLRLRLAPTAPNESVFVILTLRMKMHCRKSNRARHSHATVAPLTNRFKALWLRRRISTDRRRRRCWPLPPSAADRPMPCRRRRPAVRRGCGDAVSAAAVSGRRWPSVCVPGRPLGDAATIAWSRWQVFPARWTASARSTPSRDSCSRSPSSHLTFSTGQDSSTTSSWSTTSYIETYRSPCW